MRIKCLILAFISTSIIFGCQKEDAKLQIEEEKLIKILTDLHISEAAILSLNQKVKDSMSTVYHKQIFEIHGIEDSIFYKDLEVLRTNSEELKLIYQKVLTEVEQLGVAKIKKDSVIGIPQKNKQSLHEM